MVKRLLALCLALLYLGFPASLRGLESSLCRDTHETCEGGCDLCCAPRQVCGDDWASIEFMTGWLKDAPVPIPLVTSGSLADPLPAAIGQPGTQVLFGDQQVDFGNFSGFRASMGTWLDRCRDVGLEATGFLMEDRTSIFSTDNFSDPDLVVSLPIQLPTGEETSVFALVNREPGTPLPSTGIRTLSSSQLWGAELNAILQQAECGCRNVEGLVGFRHVNLNESLGILVDLTRPVAGGTAMTSGRDYFEAQSRFYGAQVGMRLTQRCGRALLGVSGKMALGANVDVVKVAGSRTQMNPGQASVTTAGFVFAEPTNIGHVTKTRFSVAPEIKLTCAYDLTPRLTAQVGYEVLYWSQVVRPGNQIDRVVNPTQRGGGELVGEARPTPRFETSDLFFQALTCGLRYDF
ncbi:MAG: BBP7 family outer membrane beta-barrel protein [Planctomycetaceae bacterium]|nr:BBP7 family outer membrane beta-barrel protein [Planctomycetaceae bacterium]